MASDFARPKGAEKQVKIAGILFDTKPLTAVDCMDPRKVESYVRGISGLIKKAYGKNDFKYNRLNRDQRKAAGIKKGRRWYNKRFRLLARLEDKIQRMTKENKKYMLTRVSKSALAVKITYDEFCKDLNTACFIAYMSARMNKRSMFTNKSQDRAFDEVAEQLFKRCQHSSTTNWEIIAYIMPDEKVLRHLSDQEKGKLLASFWDLLVDAADLLKETLETTDVNVKTMVVKRGNDSSTWNSAAGGWNKAREHWISLLYALKAEEILDKLCPGKVLRLMASDVARWHYMTLQYKNPKLTFEDSLHEDTKVWSSLPMPWDVVHGNATCTKGIIEGVCKKHKVKTGSWTGPRLERKAVPFKPTLELVHGVAVSNPELAGVLKKAGVFSGKLMKNIPLDVNFKVERDEFGFALGATPDEMMEEIVRRK